MCCPEGSRVVGTMKYECKLESELPYSISMQPDPSVPLLWCTFWTFLRLGFALYYKTSPTTLQRIEIYYYCTWNISVFANDESNGNKGLILRNQLWAEEGFCFRWCDNPVILIWLCAECRFAFRSDTTFSLNITVAAVTGKWTWTTASWQFSFWIYYLEPV